MDKLFEGGSALMAFPLRVLYLQTDDPDAAEVSMLVSVSKKRFHHAVDRNKVKRRVREAFRLRTDRVCPIVGPPSAAEPRP